MKVIARIMGFEHIEEYEMSGDQYLKTITSLNKFADVRFNLLPREIVEEKVKRKLNGDYFIIVSVRGSECVISLKAPLVAVKRGDTIFLEQEMINLNEDLLHTISFKEE